MDSAERTDQVPSGQLQRHEKSLSDLTRQFRESEQWAGRVNDTLTAIQETLARLVPPPTPGPSPPPPEPPASRSTCSSRDPAPPSLVPFAGELGRCGGFLIQVSLLFQRFPHVFADDASKISHLIGALRDRALSWAESYLALHPLESLTYVQFVQDFKSVFHHPLRADEAARQLSALRQGHSSVAEFSIDFRVKAAETGWGDAALHGAFICGLSERLKDELATRDEPESFEELVKLAIRIDNRLREREREKERGGQGHTTSGEGVSTRTEIEALVRRAQLHEPDPGSGPPGRLFVPSAVRARVLHWLHTARFACHPGVRRMVSLLRRSFWWPSLVVDAREYVAACEVCARSKSCHQAPSGLLLPLPVPSRPWSHVALDFVTGLPRSSGHSVILTIVDRFSKAAHFVPLPKLPSALETAHLLVVHVFRLHGIPRDIVSDRGPQFVSRVWRGFCAALGVGVSLSSGYHPQSNGQTERTNQQLESALRCVVSANPASWSSHLSWVEYAHNSLTSSATGFSPFEVWLGYQPPLFPSQEGEVAVPAVRDHLRRSRRIWRQARAWIYHPLTCQLFVKPHFRDLYGDRSQHFFYFPGILARVCTASVTNPPCVCGLPLSL
ncbi:unnamed protein product [Oreochromis niloticus]|nr:unnamed protein product [Mustela putorius furo]